MSSIERFSFAGPDVRLRISTVEGLSNTASFCVETRLPADAGGQEGGPTATVSPVPPTGLGEEPISPLGW
jgi:hypothetical protein